MAQAILAEVSVKDQLRLSVLASMEQNQGVEPAAKKRRTTGIVEALAARLKDGNHKRVQLAAEGIAELASNDRNQVFIAQVAGVVAGLSSILRSGPDHAKRSAARALSCLVGIPFGNVLSKDDHHVLDGTYHLTASNETSFSQRCG